MDLNQVENVKRLILRFDQGQDLNPDIAGTHASASTSASLPSSSAADADGGGHLTSEPLSEARRLRVRKHLLEPRRRWHRRQGGERENEVVIND